MSKKEPGAGPKAQAVASKPAVHSPLPWSGEHGDTLIMDADDITVIELHSRLRKDADMDFILKAVNSHAALVQALKDLLKECPLAGRNVKKDFSFMVARAAATKALYEAGESEHEA
jgi:hypothetical protein